MAFLAWLAFHNFSYRTEVSSGVLQIYINTPRESKVAFRLLIKMSHFISGVVGEISNRKIIKNHQFWSGYWWVPPPTPLHPTPFASHAVLPQIAILPFIEQHPFHHLELSHLHKICINLQNNENAFILWFVSVVKVLTLLITWINCMTSSWKHKFSFYESGWNLICYIIVYVLFYTCDIVSSSNVKNLLKLGTYVISWAKNM